MAVNAHQPHHQATHHITITAKEEIKQMIDRMSSVVRWKK